MLTAEQRSELARAAALARWANEDGHAQARIAQRGLLARFEREVDPGGVLPAEERLRRARERRRAYLAELSPRGIAALRARAAQRRASAVVE